jgi:hypothetical protein
MPSALPENIAPQITRIVLRMFIEPADMDYILARIGFFLRFDRPQSSGRPRVSGAEPTRAHPLRQGSWRCGHWG